jgi:glycosyltransferase involved in cell wall biosynthesis
VRLLIATDHHFVTYGSQVFDTYCFDRGFFQEYRKVFDSLEVLCRTSPVDSLPSGAQRSDGDGVRFLHAPSVHGIAWLLIGGIKCRQLALKAVARSDAVVGRIPSQLGWLSCRSAQKMGKPYMVELIGNPLEGLPAIGRGIHYKAIAHWQARRARQLVRDATAVSYVSRLKLPKLYPVNNGTPWDSISSIRLDPREITCPRSFTKSPERIRLILVASLLPYKRHEDLIRAFKLARARSMEGELHLAGDGALRNRLKELSKHLQIEKEVYFHGHIAERKILVELLDSCDLFVMTSATEGLPRVVLEAMSRGLPAIGTRAGGIEELIRETELFEVGDVESLAELLLSLSRDPERLSEMSRYSVRTASNYSSEHLSPKRLRLYRHLREAAEKENKRK